MAKTLIVLIIVLTLGGCFDISQHVTEDQDGGIVSHLTFRMQKALFELAAQMGGEPVNYNEFLEESDLTEEDFLANVPGVRDTHYEIVNTSGHFGFYARFGLSPEVTDMVGSLSEFPTDSEDLSDAVFVPFRLKEGVAVMLESLGESAEDEQSAAFMASATYNITIGKTVLNQAAKASVLPVMPEGIGDPIAEFPVRDFTDYLSVDVPLSVFMGEAPAYLVLVSRK